MPEGLTEAEMVFVRAFKMLGRSRAYHATGMGPPVEGGIAFADILAYCQAFPGDVDDVRRFVTVIQAIDREYLEHASGRSNPSSQGRPGGG